MSDCKHIWLLDDEKYFDSLKSHEIWSPIPAHHGSRIVFPAKCHMCTKQKNFTKEEWLEHKREQGFLK